MADKSPTTEDKPASPREMIDWLAFFLAPHLERREDHMMYMQIRDVIVQHFGVAQGLFRFGGNDAG